MIKVISRDYNFSNLLRQSARLSAITIGVLAAINLQNIAAANPLIVTTTDDSGSGSLREAIVHANANVSEDVITFNIPGSGPHLIELESALPDLTDAGIMIDGTSQSGTSCNDLGSGASHDLRVEVRRKSGSSAGFTVSAQDVTIQGLTITEFEGEAVKVTSTASNFLLHCSYVGIRADNLNMKPNARSGTVNQAILIEAAGASITHSVISAHADDNEDSGVLVRNTSSFSLTDSILGLLPNGSSEAKNFNNDIGLDNVSGFTLGGTSGNGNVFAGQSITDIQVLNGSTGSIVGNFIGLNASGTNDFKRDWGIQASGSGTAISVGDGTSAGRNHIAGADKAGVLISQGATATIDENWFGLGVSDQSLGNKTAIEFSDGDGGTVRNNRIANSNDYGVLLSNALPQVAIYSNSIFNNGKLGIDLNEDGATNNDAGDSDSGPNDFLNFPVLNSFTSSGTLVGYDIDLDVPANIYGYRIEFFKNTSSDSSGHGEGETFLGYFDTGNHPGGTVNFTGNFTATESVTINDVITATTTRKTASGFDITSEFALNETYPFGPLIVKNANDSGSGSLREAIVHANANVSEDVITFNIPGSGPHLIELESALPDLTDAGIMIDGTSQSGTSCNDLGSGASHDLRVEVRRKSGSSAGFTVSAQDVTIQGLTITEFEGEAVKVTSTASNFLLHCSYVGIRADNLNMKPNARSGTVNQAILIEAAGASITHSVISAHADDNEDSGVLVRNTSSFSLTDSILGLLPNGSSEAKNFNNDIGLDNVSGFTLGGTSGNGNVFAGQSITDIQVLNGSTGSIVGNFIGLNASGTNDFKRDWGIQASGSGTAISVGDGTSAGRNHIAGADKAGVLISQGATATIDENWFGLGVSDQSLGNKTAIEFSDGDGGTVRNNRIANSNDYGVLLSNALPQVAIYSNSIFNNGKLGIDLNEDGATNNDAGDSDSGPNDFLNFPVLNSFTSSGTLVGYDIDLDVPANIYGYRIEFFKNTSSDSSGHGEGETFLGYFDTGNHPGGTVNFTGNFTATESVTINDVITATTTRKTASGFDITSEFALNYSSSAFTELFPSKTVDVFDPFNEDLYAIPGSDIIHSITVLNPRLGPTDADSIVIIDAVPPELTFYNGDMDDGGPATDPVYFTQANGAGLSWTYSTDAKFSNSVSRPADMSGCTYTPSAGYDSNVTYVCFNPKGAMAAGDPDPSFTVQFRARIK